MVAPSEAEAQCAALEEKTLTQGSITDDSDIFLFGGRKVYRHFFSQDKDVEMYDKNEIESSLGKQPAMEGREISTAKWLIFGLNVQIHPGLVSLGTS